MTSMRRIFWGLLLITLDFTLHFGGSSIGLLPDFVGYLMLRRGFMELQPQSERFGALLPWTGGLAIYTGALYIIDLFGMAGNSGLLLLLAASGMAASLYVTYQLTQAVAEMEMRRGVTLFATALRSRWTYMAVCNALSLLLVWVSALAVIAILIGAVFSVLFLVTFSQTQRAFDAPGTLPGPDAPPAD